MTVPVNIEKQAPGRSRPDLDEWFLRLAELVAERATCPRLQVGAVAVRDGRIVCIGYNGAPSGQPHCTEVGCEVAAAVHVTRFVPAGHSQPGCTRAVHAEANLISFAARKGIALEGCELFLTDSPCVPCAQLVLSAKFCRVVYRTPYRITTGLELLESAGLEVVQGERGRGH